MVNFPKLKYLCLHLLSQGGNFLKQSPILKTEFLKKKKIQSLSDLQAVC